MSAALICEGTQLFQQRRKQKNYIIKMISAKTAAVCRRESSQDIYLFLYSVLFCFNLNFLCLYMESKQNRIPCLCAQTWPVKLVACKQWVVLLFMSQDAPWCTVFYVDNFEKKDLVFFIDIDRCQVGGQTGTLLVQGN